jgi:hypothetical protein
MITTTAGSGHDSLPPSIELHLPPGTLNDVSALSNRNVTLVRDDLEAEGFSTQVATDSGQSLEGIPWHREFSIRDGGTCPERKARVSKKGHRKAVGDRTGTEFRILNSVTIKTGASVATEASGCPKGDQDTIVLTRTNRGYEGTWDIGRIDHKGPVVGATSVQRGREIAVKWLGGPEWDCIRLKAQGSIVVDCAEWESKELKAVDESIAVDCAEWESNELEAVDRDKDAQAIVNKLYV